MADSAARSSGADITLVHGGVGAVADAVMLARATRRILRQNLGLGLRLQSAARDAGRRRILPPVLAVVAMATNSVTVVGNALRLRRFGKASGHRGRPSRHGLATPAAQPPAGIRAGR